MFGDVKSGIPSFSARFCPFLECPGNPDHVLFHPGSGRIHRKGFFYRSSDSRWIRRFQCARCRRTFSRATFSVCLGQKKRNLNERIRKLLCSGVSQRRIARLLRVNRKTVERKFLFLASVSKKNHALFLNARVQEKGLFQDLQFDEMESFERSKCLPVSIPLVVEPKSRKILSLRVGSMPAKGLLAPISRRKYGFREDHRPRIARELWQELTPLIHESPRILSDQNPKYPSWIRPHCPQAIHSTVKGKRGCIVGQGELKKTGYDPLFDLNHTAAMIRANINRLFRRTWCTTKRADRLELHLWLYAEYHNQVLTA